MIKQLLNSDITRYHDLSVESRSVVCLSLQLWQIYVINLLSTDKSRYFAQPHSKLLIIIRARSEKALLQITVNTWIFNDIGCLQELCTKLQ